LRDISPTVYFNVPKGYESLLPYLRDDRALRAKFFGRLHAMFFSGAALSPFVWNSLDELAVAETGFRVPMLTGLGATEASPFFMSVRPDTSRSGHVGLPVLGNDAKLVPNNGKLEVRAKGPNVMPGYWRQPELTAAAFDEEGFYKMGDALKPADPDNFDAGFDFDGRIGEDFKLGSGTWVSVGPLRARFVATCAPLVRDVVIAGINRDEISALVVLDLDEEGFYKMGDALKPADPDNFDAGFDFDGRIGEDFKLGSGTWVSVGPLRARFVATCAPLVRDVVIAGINRDEISALVVLDLD